MSAEQKISTGIEELIIINNDRYHGYKKAAEETKDPALKELFTKYSMQSHQWGTELRKYYSHADTPDRDETKLSGKFYRVWMDIKSALTGNDRKAILSSCEYGEDIAKKTYAEVLKDTGSLNSEAMTVIREQQAEQMKAHDYIKQLRDSA